MTLDKTMWKLVLVLPACVLAAAIVGLLVLAPSVRPQVSVGLAGQQEESVGLAESAPASAPATTVPASGPATASAGRKWTPPRFAARQAERNEMVGTIRGYGLTDRTILDAMAAVPRHEFVLGKFLQQAYDDTPLPIGYGQTISQPYIVAEMTRQLQLRDTSRVLEVGTGSGYQAAVLTEFTQDVYTIEIIKALADSAAERLKRLGYDVVKVRHGDGYLGWPDERKFDAIIVTCAAGQIPPPLIDQLAPGGRMVIPVGAPFSMQWLMLVTKDLEGQVRSRTLMAVRFVPLARKDVSAN